MKRVTKECIEKIQEHLTDYIEEWSKIDSHKRFQCLRKHLHKHDDVHPSASIVPGSNDKYWRCFGCGAKGDIFSAVEYKEGITSFINRLEFLSKKFNIPLCFEEETAAASPAERRRWKDREMPTLESRDQKERRVVKTYEYLDEKGQAVYRIVRREWQGENGREKDFLCYSKYNEKWSSGLKGARRVLYNLPVVLTGIKDGEKIFLVEGEKCADKINALGLIGTTTCGGAAGWKPHKEEYVPSLKNAEVIIIPDNDKPGMEYAKAALKDLKEVCRSIKLLKLPGLKEKEDIVEWVQQGGTKENLLKLCEKDGEEIEEAEEAYGWIVDADGSYCRIFDEKVVKLSNFTIKPLYYIEGGSCREYCCRVLRKNGDEIMRNFVSDDFDDIGSFRKAIGDMRFSFIGTLMDLQYIRLKIADRAMEHVNGVLFSGFHYFEKGWFFITHEGALDEKLELRDEAVLMENSMELTSDVLKMEPISQKELFTLAPALLNYNSLKITSTILGYTAGLFLKGRLEKLSIPYNHLIIEGQSGSGKSQTIRSVIMPMLCIKDNPLNAGECTNFALNRSVSSSNFVPLVIDEYKASRIGRFRADAISSLMRNSYDNNRVVKGSIGLNKNREFKSRASIILCGETGVEETANVERSLRLIFDTGQHNEKRREEFELIKFHTNLLNKLGRSLLNGGMKMKDDDIALLHKAIYDKLSSKNLENERVRNSITNCILGIALVKKVFEELGLDMEDSVGVSMKDIILNIKAAAEEDLLNNSFKSKGAIDASLETINRMAVNNELEKGVDFDTNYDSEGDFVLRLNYTAFYDRFLKYCREHSVEHDVLSLTSFKKQLSRMSYCKCYNKPVSFHVSGGAIGERKTFRAAVLYTEALKKNNLEVDFML